LCGWSECTAVGVCVCVCACVCVCVCVRERGEGDCGYIPAAGAEFAELDESVLFELVGAVVVCSRVGVTCATGVIVSLSMHVCVCVCV